MAGFSPLPRQVGSSSAIGERRRLTQPAGYTTAWQIASAAGRSSRMSTIQLGDDFVEVVTRAVGSCDVLLALIGDRWLTITDEHGRRRLDDR